MARFQRERLAGEEQRSSPLELFYDLVLVFAITQISHLLLDDLTWRGAGQSLLVLLVVWWAWNYTTWVTNELDPESPIVRTVLIALMLLTFVLGIAIPKAFGDYGLMFALSYVVIMVGRNAFLVFATTEPQSFERIRTMRIFLWLCLAAIPWIVGGILTGPARTFCWLVALAIDYGAPLLLYWVPFRRYKMSLSWDLESGHFAERFQLFMIIALGESIVITGVTTSKLDLDSARIIAFAIAFLGTAAMWLLYFSYVARIAQRRLELSVDKTRLARDGYTYLHAVMVAGIILWAVGNEIAIEHPKDVMTNAEIAAIVLGPAIYLLGHTLFRLRMAGTVSTRRLAGALSCVFVGIVFRDLPALAIMTLVVVVMALVIIAELWANHRRQLRGEPSPLEQLNARHQQSGS